MTRNKLWATGFDESVEVNQRGLINKILARYSGEFTVFRELLQNSDDAEARAVEIHFETENHVDHEGGGPDQEVIYSPNEKNLPDLKTTNIYRWTFKNNGNSFRDEDWSRLKKIAEGNPDEDKIGAFGVGFYSVFSVTEEPFVTSGTQWTGFYWKDNKDQLFARRGSLSPDIIPSPWTSFELVLREPSPMPPAFDLTRFLSSSIVFMTNLSEVSIYFDNKCLTKLSKSCGVPRDLGILGELHNISPRRMMRVKGIRSIPVEIRTEVLKWVYSTWTEKPRLTAETFPKARDGGFFSSLFSALSNNAKRAAPELPEKVTQEPSDPLSINATGLALSIYSADVEVTLEQKMIKALHRSTLKDPPNKLRYELIHTAKDEYDAAKAEDAKYADKTMSIFHGLRADLEGLGMAHIFIGHATAQTTGIGGHMAAHFIPTVERESIDLIDQNVAIWNRELLFVGGFLARSAYEHEMNNIKQIWDGLDKSQSHTTTDRDVEAWLLSRGLHALKFFTFFKSAPSEEISAALESSFFSCAPQQFPIISTRGVQNAFNVRYPDATVTPFLKTVPIIPSDVIQGAQRMLLTLRSRGMIKEISFEDIVRELRQRPLGEQEMLACLQWWITLFRTHKDAESVLSGLRRDLIDAAVLVYGEDRETLIHLSRISTFINPTSTSHQIPLDGPLPDHLFPVNLSRKLAPTDMSNCLLWTELTIRDWVKHICSPMVLNANVENNIDTSPHWSERVLSILARIWPSWPTTTREEVKTLLATRTCIPTSNGMKTPSCAYFASADIFHDLPVVHFPSGMIKPPTERLLEAIGVQKHVDLQIVFNRMVKTNEWTIADLTKYLVSIKETLTSEEMARLKATPAFSKEQIDDSNTKIHRYQARQLYEPIDVFRQMKLPVIDWGKEKKWRSSTKEANFLFELGLRRHPPLHDLVMQCAHEIPEIRRVSLKYLLDNLERLYSDFSADDYEHVAFIPSLKDSAPCLGSPKNVFVEAEWACMSFLVLDPAHSRYVARLGIAPRPSTHQLLSFLKSNQPKNKTQAQTWFKTLASRISDFTEDDRTTLSRMPIVPYNPRTEDEQPTTWLCPVQCYFSDENKARYLSKLFSFVDFGVTANSFLSVCGAKRQPSVDEVAQILLEDPRHFYTIAEGHVNFLAELRNLGINFHQLSAQTVDRMKHAPCLLGAQRKFPKIADSATDIDDFEENDWEIVYHFRQPNEIVIADDTQNLRAFGESLFTAPQEDALEELYLRLGARRLSSLVKEAYSKGAEVVSSPLSMKTRKLILERLPLLLHEHTTSHLKFSIQWLNSENNFVVKTFRGLQITKSFALGNVRLTQKQDASAVAHRSEAGPVSLWLSNTIEIDMYEVATSMNRLLFEKPRANDALLFTTILSTDLRTLKKRGFNVERILKKHTAERAAKAEAALGPISLEKSPLKSSDSRTVETKPQNDRSLLGEQMTSAAQHTGNKGSSPINHNNIAGVGSIVEKAIRACRSESDSKFDVLRSIRENLRKDYHDTCGAVDTLRYIGKEKEIKVYVAQEVSEPHGFINSKRLVLARFSDIVAMLGNIFGLPLTSLHIFFDLTSQHIAFNREGSLFFNLRFYETWHDMDVGVGKKADAYAFWYFTFAHEIAHNLVQEHNAEHEFYFAATSQKYIVKLSQLVLK
ncbi:hypothetical protein AX17_005695 [Amanita inopinata Kibby_2008]|nr:hypothetical protein AX17_005695 [Amanita inopinata Kibby_2008]